ncbi:MAG: hypothetical protein LQ340_005720 [Diploschistes diacapsis]|nr:MAG: hypothetical protein LQ340_005720 [Diploschistes diacapsis]
MFLNLLSGAANSRGKLRLQRHTAVSEFNVAITIPKNVGSTGVQFFQIHGYPPHSDVAQSAEVNFFVLS